MDFRVEWERPLIATLPFCRSTRGRPWTAGRSVRLSILMPVYNEAGTVAYAVRSVLAVRFPCEAELIVIDDGSSDGTAEILAGMAAAPGLRVLRHPRNRGKGAALRTGADWATGSHVVPFDADMEYSPEDLLQLLEPILEGRCDVVYGARVFGVRTVYQSFGHAVGNRLLTTAANVCFDTHLTDLHTCLKLMPLELLRSLSLSESGFGLDTEMTAKALRMGVRPFEVPITYHSRTVGDGKKLTWRDGLGCLRVLMKVRFAEMPETAVIPQRIDGDVEYLEPAATATRGDVHASVETEVHWAVPRADQREPRTAGTDAAPASPPVMAAGGHRPAGRFRGGTPVVRRRVRGAARVTVGARGKRGA
jgi:dolichol-phosphate hexosyltransferase